jgi:hypothetical protein
VAAVRVVELELVVRVLLTKDAQAVQVRAVVQDLQVAAVVALIQQAVLQLQLQVALVAQVSQHP